MLRGVTQGPRFLPAWRLPPKGLAIVFMVKAGLQEGGGGVGGEGKCSVHCLKEHTPLLLTSHWQ